MHKKIIWTVITILVLMAANLSAGPFYWRSQQSRQQIARDWLAGFIKLNAQIPTLSPAEERWLRTEYDDEIKSAGGVLTKRAVDAGRSKEYALRGAKPHVDQIISVLSELSSRTISDQRKEVVLWAKLASLYMDLEFWQDVDHLVSRGVLEKEINGAKFYQQTHTLWAQYIVNEIVVSYLNANLDK